jgi:NitT/TauT family transport system permease protein
MIFKTPKFAGLHARPAKYNRIILTLIPFIICLVVYIAASHYRHAENPQDKILPTFSQMGKAVYTLAFVKDPRTDTYLMLSDITSSLTRLLTGIFIASFLGLLLGIHMGLFRGIEALTSVFITIVSIIPPLAILPILFITFGVDELAKIVLIFLGTFPLICRDIDTTRLSFGSAWLFLIASEAIASTNGLGYRIFLVRRYLAMDIIIPYVILITLLGFLIDRLLKKIIVRKYAWYNRQD